MIKRYPCQIVILFLLGILTAAVSFAVFLPAFLCFVVWICKEPRRKKRLLLATVLCLAFFTGLLRMVSVSAAMQHQTKGILDGQEVSVQGKIIKKQQKSIQQSHQNLTKQSFQMQQTKISWMVCLADCYLKMPEEIRFCGNLAVYLNQNTGEPVTGNTILVKGKIKLYRKARNEGNFDECAYNQNKGYSLKLYADDSSYRIVDAHTDKFRESLYAVQQKLFQVYGQKMPQEEAGVLSAMLLGEKSMLADEIKESYRLSGIAHILAISGLHISILGAAVFRMLRKGGISYPCAAAVSFVLLAFFAVMTGMGVSAMRAVIMYGIYLGAACCGRAYDSVNALAAAAGCMLLYNPRALFLSGCQFSFAAVAGVLFGKEFCRIMKPRFRLSETLFVSFGIQMFTLPLTAWYYYEIPVYSMLLNLLVLPFVETVLIFGLAGGGFALAAASFCGYGLSAAVRRVLEPVSSMLLSVCTCLLNFFSKVSGLFIKFPGAVYLTGKPKIWQMAGCYIFLAGCMAVCMALSEKRRKNARILTALSGCAACLVFLLVRLPRQPEVVFLDVGQGDGIYIHTYDGMDIFIDGGSTDVRQAGIYRILPFLKSRGVKAVDYWFLSHLDQDHISGFLEIAESGFTVRRAVLAEGVVRDEAFAKVMDKLSEYSIQVQYMEKNDILRGGCAQFCCLGPDSRTGGNDRNAESLVLLYEDRGYSALFAGDISAKEEKMLCAKADTGGRLSNILLYKASHHGSKHSNSAKLLSMLKPAVSVVSCAKENDYGHPGKEAVANMDTYSGKVLYTMECGQIRMVRKKDRLCLYPFVSDDP